MAEPDPDRRIAGLFLISAPFCGEGGWHIDGFDLPKDLKRRLQPGLRVFLYHGGNDEVVPSAHVDLYEKALPSAVVRRLEGRNHQLNDDLSEVARDIKRFDRHIKLHPVTRRGRG